MLMVNEILMTSEDDGKTYWMYVISSHKNDLSNYDGYWVQEQFSDIPEEAHEYTVEEWKKYTDPNYTSPFKYFPQFTLEEIDVINLKDDNKRIIGYSIPSKNIYKRSI